MGAGRVLKTDAVVPDRHPEEIGVPCAEFHPALFDRRVFDHVEQEFPDRDEDEDPEVVMWNIDSFP